MLREAVRRDIEVLFNTERFESVPLLTAREAEARADDPPVARRLSRGAAQRGELRRAALRRPLDPRLRPRRRWRASSARCSPPSSRGCKESATRVTVSTSEKTGLAIEIDGLLIMSPAPERLRLRTLVDLETGRARTTPRGRPEVDRAFLEYYEDELAHIRALAAEFADLHPAVARNLSLDTVPCPDPYVERLLEGVAFLAARTRLKLDGEGARFARAVLDALYPDLIAPTPAVGMVALQPGQQVQTMLGRPRGAARHPARRRPAPRPVDPRHLHHRPGRDALADRDHRASPTTRTAARSPPPASARVGGQAAARRRSGSRCGAPAPGALAELALDRLDLHFRNRAKAPALFDALFGAVRRRSARGPPAPGERAARRSRGPALVGLADDEALMPRTRAGFEGYRLLREYFMMPERFHFARVDGLRPVVARCAGGDRARLPAAPAGAGARRPPPAATCSSSPRR